MKKNWKRIASLFLSVLLLLSMTVTPVMAAEGKAAPTEVKSCTSSGLWTTVLNLEFEDTTWMQKPIKNNQSAALVQIRTSGKLEM